MEKEMRVKSQLQSSSPDIITASVHDARRTSNQNDTALTGAESFTQCNNVCSSHHIYVNAGLSRCI